MLVLIISVGWVLVLPVCVVATLHVASKILGDRARRRGSIDVSGLAREFAALSTPEQVVDSRPVSPAREPVRSAY